ncbi:MAG: hypothetical protein ACFB6R_10990 [Alphaproteobacteria bacterium]
MRCRLVILFMVASLAGGCASIVKGSARPVQVRVEGPDRALCTLRNKKVDLQVQAPSVVPVKARGPLDVTCVADGYETGRTTIDRKFAYWTLGNLGLGGLIGIAIDAGTGAISVYKDDVVVQMREEV